jgi:hypothetical protein
LAVLHALFNPGEVDEWGCLDRLATVPAVPVVPEFHLTCEDARDFEGQRAGTGVPGVPAFSNSLSLCPSVPPQRFGRARVRRSAVTRTCSVMSAVTERPGVAA